MEDRVFFHKVQMIYEIRKRLAFMQISEKLGKSYLQKAINEARQEALAIGMDQEAIEALFG